MSAHPVAPPLEILALRVGTRPHALVRRLTRATLALFLSGLCGLLVLSLIYPRESLEPQWAVVPVGLALLLSGATGVGALLAQLACWIGPIARGRLSVGRDGVWSSGLRSRFIRRDDIAAAWVLREPEGASVELRLRNGDVFSATTATMDEATAVLDAAGVDPARRALRMPLGGAAANLGVGLAASLPASCVSSLIGGIVAALLHLPSVALGLLVIALFIAFVVAAVQLLAPPAVAVGSDGLSVGGGRRAWFVPFVEIGAVEYGRGDLTLRLRDGRVRRISTLGTREARREALYARITAGAESARAPLDLSTRLTALDRNGRSAEEWRVSLRQLAEARDGYRQTGLTRDEVEAALDDPRSSPDRRIGAAYALSAMDPSLASTRVRVLTETVAHEPVRIALERAAAGELDEEVADAADEGRAKG